MSATTMVVVDFSNQRSPLPGVWPATHKALLPVCGKPLIVHLLEQLSNLGYRHFRFARSPAQHAIRSRLEQGQEWGARVRYSDLHTKELLMQTLATEDRCLYLPGDEWIEVSKQPGLQTSADPRAALKPGLYESAVEGLILKETGTTHLCQSPADYHALNLEILSNGSAVVPGAPLHHGNAFADWKSYLHPAAFAGENVFIGKHGFIDQDVRLESDCILSNGVFVGARCLLNNVTVLPNTHIHADTQLENAVLTPEGVFPLQAAGSAIELIQHQGIGRWRSNNSARTGLPNDAYSLKAPAGSHTRI